MIRKPPVELADSAQVPMATGVPMAAAMGRGRGRGMVAWRDQT
ncbi:hypothetical protein AB0H86_26530 [Streptomyces sp. NPDC050997]